MRKFYLASASSFPHFSGSINNSRKLPGKCFDSFYGSSAVVLLGLSHKINIRSANEQKTWEESFSCRLWSLKWNQTHKPHDNMRPQSEEAHDSWEKEVSGWHSSDSFCAFNNANCTPTNVACNFVIKISLSDRRKSFLQLVYLGAS